MVTRIMNSIKLTQEQREYLQHIGKALDDVVCMISVSEDTGIDLYKLQEYCNLISGVLYDNYYDVKLHQIRLNELIDIYKSLRNQR